MIFMIHVLYCTHWVCSKARCCRVSRNNVKISIEHLWIHCLNYLELVGLFDMIWENSLGIWILFQCFSQRCWNWAKLYLELTPQMIKQLSPNNKAELEDDLFFSGPFCIFLGVFAFVQFQAVFQEGQFQDLHILANYHDLTTDLIPN